MNYTCIFYNYLFLNIYKAHLSKSRMSSQTTEKVRLVVQKIQFMLCELLPMASSVSTTDRLEALAVASTTTETYVVGSPESFEFQVTLQSVPQVRLEVFGQF